MDDTPLIFDIGLHTGQDALFYLRKGFRVVGLEAREDLCEIARNTCVDFAESGKLTVVQRALFPRSGETVTFFINDKKDDWGSLFRGAAEQDGSTAREITVPTTTLEELFREFGTPYFIKCDIEGGDALFVEQLLHVPERPTYVSFEATTGEDLAMLRAAGYNRFQVRNQFLNPQTVEPNPAREGLATGMAFSHAMSGLFGRDLPTDRWNNFNDTAKLLLDWYDLRARDPSLAVGWLDIHATTW